MRRVHLVELEDMPWFPPVARDAVTGCLGVLMRLTGHAPMLAPLVARALQRSGAVEILDLCSGGGGPILAVLPGLGGARVTLTDLYPNLPAFREAAARHPGRVAFRSEPLDATQVPPDLPGLRTLFNGLHHLRPREARGVLASAVEAGHPVLAVELAGRSPRVMGGILLVALVSLVAMPFVRPVRWDWLFYTYVVPLVPLVLLVDGFVSCLRVYCPHELRDLVEGLDADWEIGTVPAGRIMTTPATYVLGIPRRRE